MFLALSPFFQSSEAQLKDFTQERHTFKSPHMIICDELGACFVIPTLHMTGMNS